LRAASSTRTITSLRETLMVCRSIHSVLEVEVVFHVAQHVVVGDIDLERGHQIVLGVGDECVVGPG
jgi:hypothetical protein